MSWMKTLHVNSCHHLPALSIRHGMDLKGGTEFRAAEARLYCDRTSSYIAHLLSEHTRLHRA